jgi:hypothetical protein
LKRKQLAEDKLGVLVAEERKRAQAKNMERQEKVNAAFNKAKGFVGKVFSKEKKSIYE